MQAQFALRAGVAAAAAAAVLIPAPLAPARTPRQGPTYNLPCASRRNFDIHVQRVHRLGIVAAEMTVNGKPLHVRREKGGFFATIDLRDLSKVVFTVDITAHTRNGKTLHGKRVYHPCRPKRPDHRPPRL